jgi:hypothetical protein
MNLSYEDIQNALAHAHELITPAELHGLLTGLVCTGLKNLDQKTTDLVLHLTHPLSDNEINNTLTALFHATQQKIGNFELDFQLLLPDDDAPLKLRAQEFGKWCEGFLAGVGLGSIGNNYNDKDDVQDILYKLSEAAKIQFEAVDFTEEDETAFMEVTEFVRMAVFSVYTSLTGLPGPLLMNDDMTDTTIH